MGATGLPQVERARGLSQFGIFPQHDFRASHLRLSEFVKEQVNRTEWQGVFGAVHD
jgi:hypothetical protein